MRKLGIILLLFISNYGFSNPIDSLAVFKGLATKVLTSIEDKNVEEYIDCYPDEAEVVEMIIKMYPDRDSSFMAEHMRKTYKDKMLPELKTSFTNLIEDLEQDGYSCQDLEIVEIENSKELEESFTLFRLKVKFKSKGEMYYIILSDCVFINDSFKSGEVSNIRKL